MIFCLFLQLSTQLPRYTAEMHGADFNFDIDTADLMLKEHLDFFDGMQERTVQLIQKVSMSGLDATCRHW